MMYKLFYTARAKKDAKRVHKSHFKHKVEELLKMLEENSLKNPPPFEELIEDLKGAYSRRINIQHRLVYQILEEEHIVKVLSMWDHYE
ncbi:toxin of toxin-antitoxin system [Opitutia bacterium SCGC AG-212-L18]|nr:toxin of toxin-antitoxin system [Opitutae bacterium SCGC AG-212-L18]